ncbi:zincin-like metallopeptidase toxin domain-containing protein [Psychrobacillus sp. FSL K6-2684]|uniref:zincin-like metallopeptidase toxin domain-containing protein n=1 Tax=unclassified Psychrobacillus TaxID=2636677 RepID=UPI0012472EE9|nr:zincin-like metallopeptidase toxin domain-containing protein [Psychrobacillus sp. AK 1817]QEY20012.1 hypothetical protein D0S48_04500 [Psychrobacillus sp. AK 1817]
MLGYVVPGLGAAKAIRGTSLGAKGLTTGISARNLGQFAKEGASIGGIVSIGEIGGRELLNPEDTNWKQNALDLGLNIGAGATLDPLLSMAVPIAKSVKKMVNEKSIIEAVNPPSKTGEGLPKGTGKIDYVEDTGRLGGKYYSEKDLKLLGNYLGKRGVTLKVGDEFLPPGKGGGFNYNTGELVLKSNPTQYEVWHELSHYIQYKQIGKEAYSKLPRTSGSVPITDLTRFNAPEQFVYDMLSNNPKRWNYLNEAEQLHANWYITQYGGIR